MKWEELSLDRYEEGQEFIGVYKGTKKEDDSTYVLLDQGGKTIELSANHKLLKFFQQVNEGELTKVECLGKYITQNNNKAYNWRVWVEDKQ